MQKELIYSASKLFPTFEHWQSFLELANSKDAIVTSWFIEATTKIRRHFIETLPTEWDCAPWGTTDLDTRWFLKQFGPDSLTVSWAHLDTAPEIGLEKGGSSTNGQKTNQPKEEDEDKTNGSPPLARD